MMRAYFKTRPDLVISILFHLIIFLGLIVFFFVKSCTKEKSLYVFEMVEIKEESASIPQFKPKQKAKSTISQQKEMMPIKRLDYKQFLKENAKLKSQIKDKPIQNKLKPLPKFQAQVDSQAFPSPMHSSDSSALQEYGRYVFSKISDPWNKPSVNSGKNLSVKVKFLVLSTGRIESVKIVQSSGNQNFDNSILKVFKTIAQFKPTPSGNKETFTMNFKLSD